MDTDNEIRQLILKNASSDEIREAARRAGHAHAGARTAGAWCGMGVTTVEEVLSVTTAKEVARARPAPEAAERIAEQAADRRSLNEPCHFSIQSAAGRRRASPKASSRPPAGRKPSGRWRRWACGRSAWRRRPRRQSRSKAAAAGAERLGSALFARVRTRSPRRALENFTRLLSSLLAAGVPLSRALVILYKEASDPGRRGASGRKSTTW